MICNKCNIKKSKEEFYFRKELQIYKKQCKTCQRSRAKVRRAETIENIKKRRSNHYQKNKERLQKQGREYYHNNKEKIINNARVYFSNRYNSDSYFKLKQTLRNRLRKVLKSKKLHKDNKFAEYIGCSLEELKQHLESQFQPGMSWENHTTDGWHVDHIVPLDSASTSEEMMKLSHYTNLQPMWAIPNIKKGNKI